MGKGPARAIAARPARLSRIQESSADSIADAGAAGHGRKL